MANTNQSWLCFAEKCEDSVNIYKNWKTEHAIWDALLNELHCKVPFGPKEARVS